MPEEVHREHRRSGGFAVWLATGLAAFVAAGTVDWLLAISTTTEPGIAGASAAWVVFCSIWLVGGAVWAIATAAITRAAGGMSSPIPLVRRLTGRARNWWNERHDTSRDVARLATVLSSLFGAVLFATTTVALTTWLIETREVAWLIAATSLVAQLAVAAIAFAVAMALRRGLRALLSALRGNSRFRWLNASTVTSAIAVTATVGAVAVVATAGRDLFAAVAGPAIALVCATLFLHPALAYLIHRRWTLPTFAARMVWIAPLAAVVAGGFASQHSDARRIVVMHGETAPYAFNRLYRHVDVDRVFSRENCPTVGPDGRPTDGTTVEKFDARCMDPAFDRPTSREETPPFERPELERPPSFVFVTWDSTRIDRLGFMGHDRNTTPNLDEFADTGVVFERAFAQDSGTGPSFWSLFAGKTPFQVDLENARRFPPPISDDEPMLGELLGGAGYRNEAIVCGTMFDRDYWGIRWGFERFENVCDSRRSRVAPTVTDRAIDALAELTDGGDPFFLWVHYFDPHRPYNDHDDVDFGTDRLDRYDEELHYTDRHFGELLDAVDEVGSDERPLFVMFGADHGENFGEHGDAPHARNLYRVVTHVPMVVHGPGIRPRRIDAPVAFGDFYPSTLELADVGIPEQTTMISQVPVYFGANPDDERMVFQENSFSRPRRHTRAVVYGRYHYIMDLTTHTREMYDYIDDPLERHNLVGTGLDEERVLRQALIRFLRTTTLPDELKN